MVFSLASRLFLQSRDDDWNALRSSGRMVSSPLFLRGEPPWSPVSRLSWTASKRMGPPHCTPDAIRAAWEAAGSTAWRDRLLTPVVTVPLFLLQILHGHTACRHLPPLAGFSCSAAASCQARATRPSRVLAPLLERLGQSTHATGSAAGRWHGPRTCCVEGSGCAMPDTPP